MCVLLLQAAGYEVYVAKPLNTVVSVCAAQNVHSRSEADIAAASAAWERCPPTHVQLDLRPLLHVQEQVWLDSDPKLLMLSQ